MSFLKNLNHNALLINKKKCSTLQIFAANLQSLASGDEDGDKDDDDRDVVYIESSIEPTPNLNLLRTKNPLRESHDDEGDVVYISSTGGSRCGFVEIFANNP